MSEGWSSISRNSTNGRILFRRTAPIRWTLRALVPIAPKLVGRIGFLLFRTTQRYPLPSRERSWVDGAEPVELLLDGERLCGWSWGEGPSVLLMHGWGGRGSQMGGLATAIAEAGFRAIALDAPGHGGSAGRLSSLPQFAATVALAAEKFGPLRGVVAHSFGAAGTGWALREPLGVEKLVFVAAPGDLQGYLSGVRDLFGLTDVGLAHMIGNLERSFGIEWRRSRHATTITADATPMLVVHDEGDDETPYSGGLEIARAWPNSRLITTEGLGHRRILRDPQVLAQVTAFLAAGAAGFDRDAGPAAERKPESAFTRSA